MAFQRLPGSGMWVPEILQSDGGTVENVAFQTAGLIDATGEKAAFCGSVFTGGGAKNITKVGIHFGAVTKAGGSALTLSLQDVLLTTVVNMTPDETQDQTVAIANANAAFASNTYLHSAALSAVRAVSPGDLLAVVLEFDGAGRLGADSVVLQGTNSPFFKGQAVSASKAGAGPTWSIPSNCTPVVILEFDDGTFGSLDGCWPASAYGNFQYKSNSTPDEYAMAFSFPYPVQIDAFWLVTAAVANTGDFSVILYDGTSAMTNGTVAIDANSVYDIGDVFTIIRSFPAAISLLANHTYYLSVQPTQATSNARMYYVDVNANGHMQAMPGGAGWNLTSRTDAGAWAAVTNTRRPLMGMRVCACDDAAGASGGGTLVRNHGFPRQ